MKYQSLNKLRDNMLLQVANSYPDDIIRSVLKKKDFYSRSERQKKFYCGSLCQETDYCRIFCIRGMISHNFLLS